MAFGRFAGGVFVCFFVSQFFQFTSSEDKHFVMLRLMPCSADTAGHRRGAVLDTRQVSGGQPACVVWGGASTSRQHPRVVGIRREPIKMTRVERQQFGFPRIDLCSVPAAAAAAAAANVRWLL